MKPDPYEEKRREADSEEWTRARRESRMEDRFSYWPECNVVSQLSEEEGCGTCEGTGKCIGCAGTGDEFLTGIASPNGDRLVTCLDCAGTGKCQDCNK